MSLATLSRLVLALATCALLAACESAEERAAGHFESAQELVAAGDVDRALVELRNVFQLDNRHKEARRLYADLMREQGRPGDAYRQYLRLVEQFPEDVDGLRALSELSLALNEWEAAERYVPRGFELAPEDLGFRAMNALVTYRTAREEENAAEVNASVTEAQAVLDEDDSQYPARQVIIDSLLEQQQLTAALEQIDIALGQTPEDLRLHEIKLRVLGALQDNAALGRHLEEMIVLFPENEEVRGLLIRWYVTEGKNAEAEAFLRQLAEAAEGEERRQGYLTVIRFLRQSDGPEASLAEIDARIASGEDTAFFRTIRAATNFDLGDRQGAIEELQDVIATAGPDDEIIDTKAALARMLEATGDNIGARNLVEEILAENEFHVIALQMRAGWQIEDDQTGEAIQTLRTALDQEPRNPETLTLMARAHLRDGSRDLAGERLSLAVEASGRAPAESLRYAQFLLADERTGLAEEVLIEALRQAPQNLDLLQALGDLYMQQADWLQTRRVIDQMSRIGTPQADTLARNLQTTLLWREGRVEDSVAFLQDRIEAGDTSLSTALLVIEGHLQNGDFEAARAALETLMAENPDNPTLRLVSAGIYAGLGETDEAEAVYTELLAEEPGNAGIVTALYTLMEATGRNEEARQVLEDGIAATGNSAPQLLTIKAGLLEQAGDYDGAIAIYEDLYAQYSSNVILANNLASLITTYRDDQQSLERAAVVARRLRGTDVPAFQDTYGWIEYRRGNFEEAVAYLEPAAASLPDDPMVQMHLGLAYAATEQTGKARETLEKAIALAGDTPNPRLELARDALETLPQDDL